jgi:predicted nucleotidyltransferase
VGTCAVRRPARGERPEWNNLRTFVEKEKAMSYLDEIKLGLSALKPELSGRFHVSIIGLFGSVVRSDFSPTASDIDIIVDFSQPVGVEFIDLANYLESKFHKKIDLVSRGGIKPKYYSAIEKDIVYV